MSPTPRVIAVLDELDGLTPATTPYFRDQITTPKTGTADWSQIISLLVKQQERRGGCSPRSPPTLPRPPPTSLRSTEAI